MGPLTFWSGCSKRCERGNTFRLAGHWVPLPGVCVSNPKNKILASSWYSPALSQLLHAFLGHPGSQWPGFPSHQAKVMSFELHTDPFVPAKTQGKSVLKTSTWKWLHCQNCTWWSSDILTGLKPAFYLHVLFPQIFTKQRSSSISSDPNIYKTEVLLYFLCFPLSSMF